MIKEYIHEIKSIKKHSRSQEALELLHRLAKDTHKVLKRHGWRVTSLQEFYPKNKSLLGININRSVIKVRLRSPHDINSFMEYHHLLGTMVHEITHMKHSNHSAAFYETMDSLHDEVDEDMLTPTFDEGKKVGGATPMQSRGEVSVNERRRLTAEAAKKRLQTQTLLGTGGRKLGGAPPPRSKDDRRKAAAEAAERRMCDNEWCPAESRESENGRDNFDYANQWDDWVSYDKESGNADDLSPVLRPKVNPKPTSSVRSSITAPSLPLSSSASSSTVKLSESKRRATVTILSDTDNKREDRGNDRSQMSALCFPVGTSIPTGIIQRRERWKKQKVLPPPFDAEVIDLT